MIKNILKVPANIRYIKEWTDYDLSNFQFPHILNKTLTGCGFTSYALESNLPIVLCSPRKRLIENKMRQIPGMFYFNMEDDSTDYYNLLIQRGKELGDYLSKVSIPKILTTYDSFKHVKKFLGDRMQYFYVVVDEFQSIFNDSQLKGDVELEFVNHLLDIQKVCFVSATPMMEEYLDEVDVFKNLPYYEFDWNALEPDRVIKPDLSVIKKISSITAQAKIIIEKYKAGKFEKVIYKDEDGIHCVESKEAVFYVNSVNNIYNIIKSCKLVPDECNILVARTKANLDKIKKLGKGFDYGTIPLEGEPHKTFTFCTSTVYLGADFYSTNARTFIFSDANVESLATDISLDLPQILGRQRLDCNPWKGKAEFYFKTVQQGIDYKKILQDRLDETKEKMRLFEATENDAGLKRQVLEFIKEDQNNFKFEKYYLTVSDKGELEYNKFVYLSQKRAYEISQVDYADRFVVFNTLSKSFNTSTPNIDNFIKVFDSITDYNQKLKYLTTTTDISEDEKMFVVDRLKGSFGNIYRVLGPERIKALGCNCSKCMNELRSMLVFNEPDYENEIYKSFNIGNFYSKADIKIKLQNIYESCNGNPNIVKKANEISKYFTVKEKMIRIGGKRVAGYELLNKKH